MQTDWELSKENFQPLKRGRKEVTKPVGLVDNKAEIERQRRQVKQHVTVQYSYSNELISESL